MRYRRRTDQEPPMSYFMTCTQMGSNGFYLQLKTEKATGETGTMKSKNKKKKRFN